MSLDALRGELERNMEIARSTRSVIRGERDMLQVDLQQRLTLYHFHTDVWQAVVNGDRLAGLDDADVVSACYMRLREINELVDNFQARGNPKLYSPLLRDTREGYGRRELVDIIATRCEEVIGDLRAALQAVGAQLERRCPVCGERFASRSGMKSHVTQKQDEAHQRHAVDL